MLAKASLIVFLLVFCFSSASGQTAIVCGKISPLNGSKVYFIPEGGKSIFDLAMHTSHATDSVEPNSDGSFRMVVSRSRPGEFNLKYGADDIAYGCYLAPSDSLFVECDLAKESTIFSGTCAKYNDFLVAFRHKFFDGEVGDSLSASYKRLNVEDFLRMIAARRKSMHEYFDSTFAGKQVSPEFRSFERADIDYYCYAVPKLDYPGVHDYVTHNDATTLVDDSYFDFPREINLQDSGALIVPSYSWFLDKFIGEKWEQRSERRRATGDSLAGLDQMSEKFKLCKKMLSGIFREIACAQVIKLDLTFLLMRSGSRLDSDRIAAKVRVDDFLSFARDSSMRAGVEALFQRTMGHLPGNPAPNFTLQDSSGRQVSLTDFKGKVVYLDFWATWCGSCMGEIESAKKLQQRMKGKDVVFLSVSVDASIDEWKAMLRKKSMSGVQLIDTNGWESNALSGYLLGGLPIYAIIFRNSKVVTMNANRPSQPGIDEALLSALKSNSISVRGVAR